MRADSFNLDRFVQAQLPVIRQVREELREGRKRSHWMWFVFPQIKGLGESSMSARFALQSLGEATAYLQHPTLGPRLEECTQLVLDLEGRKVEEIFGYPDHLKFWSCMTIFALASPEDSLFRAALRKYFNGQIDPETVERM